MSGQRLFCLGYGYVARRFAPRLIASGWTAAGTIRVEAKAAALLTDRAAPVLWPEQAFDAEAFDGVSAILVSTPPGDDGCPAFATSRDAITAHGVRINWIGYLSTNGVYGDHAGAWVDEGAALNATSPRALNRIAAENQWRGFARAHNLPLVIFRLPGIYGPGRSALDSVRAGRAQRIVKEGQVFSRAHVDDIASALEASIANPAAGDLFNIADDLPAPPQDVIAYACRLLGVPPPPLVSINDANLSEMAKSFYADNKRVSNALMKARLLPSLNYPTYREGLTALCNNDQ